MKEIGGYFEIEAIPCGFFPHLNGTLLSSGRNAFEHILTHIPDIRGIWVPYYTCDAVLEPIVKLGISCKFYKIDDSFEIKGDIVLAENEYIVITNYFGIKDSYIRKKYIEYGDHLIVDCAQALFSEFDQQVKAFYSYRKFVGVPDGGVACGLPNNCQCAYGFDDSLSRCNHLFIRKHYSAEAGFSAYKENELKFCSQDVLQMSDLTRFILGSLDYDKIVSVRRQNFEYINSKIGGINMLDIPDSTSFACPMVYPFFTNNGEHIRMNLIDHSVFVAKYWPTIDGRCECDRAVSFTKNLVALPIDQRYNISDMDYIITTILESL